MKIKTSDLTGIALDWAVAKCEYDELACKNIQYPGYAKHYTKVSPSTNWAQGGPIIEREIDQLDRFNDYPNWEANRFATDDYENCVAYGPTPLIAAMRCFVASKLGEEVEIPNELIIKEIVCA